MSEGEVKSGGGEAVERRTGAGAARRILARIEEECEVVPVGPPGESLTSTSTTISYENRVSEDIFEQGHGEANDSSTKVGTPRGACVLIRTSHTQVPDGAPDAAMSGESVCSAAERDLDAVSRQVAAEASLGSASRKVDVACHAQSDTIQTRGRSVSGVRVVLPCGSIHIFWIGCIKRLIL